MKKLKKHDVIVDICPQCGGMWLDAGEIDKLAAYHRSHHDNKHH